MAVAKKYQFDQCFDPPGSTPQASAARTPPPPPEPTFSAAELAAAEAKGREAGYAAGRDEAVSAHEALVAATLDRVAAGLASSLVEAEALRRANEREVVQLGRSFVGKLFPALARRDGLAEIEALIAGCVGECLDEPRLVVRVPDALFDGIEARLNPLVASKGFQGKLVILGDESLGNTDCRIEWADGGVERDSARSLRDIDAAIGRAVAQLSSATPTPAISAATAAPAGAAHEESTQ